MAPTEAQFASWDAILWTLLGEMGEAYGETPVGQYAPEPEMALRLAWSAVNRELTTVRAAEIDSVPS